MIPKRVLYDEMCSVLTDYEGNGSEIRATADDLYSVLVKIQNQWDSGALSNENNTAPSAALPSVGVTSPSIDPRGILTDWLSGMGPYAYKAKEYNYTLIRVRKNADFDYLYTQQHYRGTGIERRDKFEYAGIYCKRDGLVYDGSFTIDSLFDDPESRTMHRAENLHKQLEFAVRKTVEAAIGNDRNNLRIAELSDKYEIDKLERYRSYEAASKARKAYLHSDDDNGGGILEVVFRCDYCPEQWTEDSLLAYILDPNSYVRAEAAKYIDSHQEHMLSDFLANDLLLSAYSEIVDTPSNPVHLVKRIMRAVSATSAKTITITIRKAGIEFSFKTEAREFHSDCTSSYSNWNIIAADRREFERLFGRSSNYRPEDILRIEYARSVLYENETAGVS